MPDTTSFTLTDAADILAPYIAREQRRDAVNLDHYRKEVERTRGLSFHVEPPIARTDAQIHTAAQASKAYVDTHQASDTGRCNAKVHAALAKVRDLGPAVLAVQAALSREDGSAGRFAEDAAALVSDLATALAEIAEIARSGSVEVSV